MPGFKKFHQQLERLGLQTCIATASTKVFTDIVEEKLGILEKFKGKLFSIDDVGNKSKPDPAVYLYAAEKMHSKPNECFVIEDMPKGVAAAKNAGMKCIAITHTVPTAMLSAADMTVDKFSEIDLAKL
jgi:HAD superfamily hydrolase (TIGR01509 family)